MAARTSLASAAVRGTCTLGAGTRVTLAYDALGDRLQIADSTGVTTYSYTPRSETWSKVQPGAYAITNQYDPVGNRVLLIDSKGGYETTTYDGRNMVVGVLDAADDARTSSLEQEDVAIQVDRHLVSSQHGCADVCITSRQEHDRDTTQSRPPRQGPRHCLGHVH